MSELTIELVNAEEVPDYRPDWLPDDIAEYGQITPGLLELGYCMEYNSGPFAFADIATAVVTKVEKDGDVDTMGDGEWEWLVTLRNGQQYVVKGWHDYTGWDCQSGAEYFLSPEASQ